MYVPAERNLVSSVERLEKVKNLPSPLYTFYGEYADARNEFSDGIALPVLNSRITFGKQGKPRLIGEDYQISLSEASSGFHSLVPLVVVTQYLSRIVKKELNKSRKEFSREEEIKLRNAIIRLLGKKDMSDEVLSVALEELSARYTYKSFINIVEEPEQNLFPDSQRLMINYLLKYHNEDEKNKLVITTHSPYVINYLTLAIKAHLVWNKQELMGGSSDRLSEIVPKQSAVLASNVSIYELNEMTGNIIPLDRYEGLPSDENYLNNYLEEFNNLFVQLLELEINGN